MMAIKQLARGVLARTPYISGLRRRLKLLEAAQGAFDAGSFFSPIPDPAEVSRHFERDGGATRLLNIDLRRDEQSSLLKQLSTFYTQLPFPMEQEPPFRYYLNCTCFGCADGILLHSFLRHFQPRQVVEIGTGWSSTVILDTLARSGSTDCRVTFVEPWPDNAKRLRSRMTPSEAATCTLLEQKVQDVDAGVFAALRPGDLLFIASSHVIKCGNDVHRLFFEVLPGLAPGVFVQFHGISYPFEYPRQWLAEGRYWNEAYLLRAFLSYNDSWEIVLFNDYVSREFGRYLREHMPLWLGSPGSSIYLRRTK